MAREINPKWGRGHWIGGSTTPAGLGRDLSHATYDTKDCAALVKPTRSNSARTRLIQSDT